ncbi:hypothetical protein ACTU44_15880 [Thalassospira sp. SM2505]|uniref:Uncharacterized protein n=1 Tax=Thalassospira profundimaris TaxID=502049 RepID=A0A367WYD4_9PROT|nr:hypothetical protein [Thalassospira profundimaris]RCK45432.1 hypothetical protein TH30_12675 [Thalassospira profundimaris]
MTTEKIGGIELYIENVDLENSGQTQKVYGTNCADDFWALLSNERSVFAYVDYLWVPPDLKRNTSQSSRALYAWRGDTRPPDEIFGHGFSRRGTSPATPAIVYRKADQDLAHYTAVCLSGTHEIGALFPPKVPDQPDPAAETWVYCVRLRGYWCPTYSIQQRVYGNAARFGATERQMARQNLYARELAVLNVAYKDVVAAIRVRRDWAGEGYDAGGTFTYLELRKNQWAASDNKAFADRIENWWNTNNLINTQNALPTP